MILEAAVIVLGLLWAATLWVLVTHIRRQRASERTATPLPSSIPNPQSAYQAVANASWEIDLWGKLRRQTESAQADLQATDEERRGVVLTLVASVVSDGKRTVEEKLADPSINAKTGARYLAYLLKLFPGRVDLAVAAYTAGEGAVARYKKQVPPFKETQNYVKTVLQLYAAFNPDAAGWLDAIDDDGKSKSKAAKADAGTGGNKATGLSDVVVRRGGQRVHIQLNAGKP